MLQQLDTLIGFVVVMAVVSLLITILTQIASNLLALRGRNLLHSLEMTFNGLAPGVAAQSKALAQRILTDSVVSDTAWKWIKNSRTGWIKASGLATAVRPGEILTILESIATAPGPLAAAANALLAQIKTQSTADANAIAGLTTTLASLTDEALLKAKERILELQDVTRVALTNLGAWFNAAQDRAQQRFATHMRVITIIASIVTAFVLQLDTFALLRQISSNSDLRARLVASSGALQAQAEQVFNDADPTNVKLHTAVLAALPAEYASLTKSVSDTQVFTSKHFILQRDIENWMRDQLKGEDSRKVDAFIDAYHDQAQALVGKRIERMREQFGAVSQKFSDSGLSLWPDPYPRFGYWSWPLPRLMGILASAALLSLGAPFWFNSLKTLTNLRPIVAEKVEKKPNLVD